MRGNLLHPQPPGALYSPSTSATVTGSTFGASVLLGGRDGDNEFVWRAGGTRLKAIPRPHHGEAIRNLLEGGKDTFVLCIARTRENLPIAIFFRNKFRSPDARDCFAANKRKISSSSLTRPDSCLYGAKPRLSAGTLGALTQWPGAPKLVLANLFDALLKKKFNLIPQWEMTPCWVGLEACGEISSESDLGYRRLWQ